LFKCSIQVIGANRKLLVFPIIIALLMCVIAMFFILPIAFWSTGHAYTDAAHWRIVAQRWITWDAGGKNVNVNSAGYVLLAGIYLVSTFLATFFNVAFYNEILNALRGRPVSIAGGLRLASARMKAIVAWSLFTGVVGLIIRLLEERVGLVGRWIIGLIGIAWSVASVFVVPVIVLETGTASPLHFLKSSATMLKRTWGESLLGYLGVQFGGLLVFAGSLVLLAFSIWLSFAFNTFWILGIAFVVWFISLAAFMYLLNVASQVYLGALYLYAAEGMVPGPFDRDQMNMAWKLKSGGQIRSE
jgi:hypothetical protein